MKIFLSHRSRDKAIVRDFKERLPKFLHTWLDEDSLVWGDSIADKLKTTIRSEVDFLVIFLSGDTLNSAWVKKELGWALDREKDMGRAFVLPIVLEEGKKLPPELSERLYLRLPDSNEQSINNLAHDAAENLFQLVANAMGAAPQLRKVIEQALREEDAQRDLWTRPMLQLPIEEKVVEKVFKVFNAAVKVAGQSLCEAIPNAKPDKVRANVFFPTSENVHNGDVCTLTIPIIDPDRRDRLQKNMSNEKELDIAFRPDEGATGRVFVQKQAIGVVTHPKWLAEKDKEKRRNMERWVYVGLHPEEDISEPGKSLYTESGKNDFNMRDFQNRRVDENLTWIISMPIFLRIKNRFEVVGVFNVDCLEHQIEPKVLRAIYYRILPLTGALSGVLRGLPTDRVAIIRVSGE